MMNRSVPAVLEPDDLLSDPAELLAGYLDYYRSALLRKLDGLTDQELRTSLVPSGWTPLELLKHLAYVERRWLQWGFLGRDVEDPWGDLGPQDRWQLADGETAADVIEFFLAQCETSRQIAAAASLPDIAAGGGRFDAQDPPPSLSWILFHLLQEYARHVGQLDVVRELADGAVGE
jgi:uncharacterized damage-inducible protein DinB